MNENSSPNSHVKPSACCPPAKEESTCGGRLREASEAQPGYRTESFITGWHETAAGRIPVVSHRLRSGDLFGRWQMRWGFGRDRYRVAPGLYALGAPGAESPVLVTANYKLTFDLVRRDTADLNAWLLVLDTRGVNVWCAAGKGTFGTEELVRRIAASRLGQVVSHRRLILPQLGAVGVAAHRVKQQSGYEVVYGPVRAKDLPAFIAAGLQATAAMRRVSFTMMERLVLTPVELTACGRKILFPAVLLFLLGGIGPELFSFSAAAARGAAAISIGLVALVSGAVFTPLLLPWLPGRAFACKGMAAGLASSLVALLLFGTRLGLVNGVALVLALPAIASFAAMNFTGSTTFTSPSGVEKEMRRAIPLQFAALLAAGTFWIAAAF